MAPKSKKTCACVCHGRSSWTGLNLCDKCKGWLKKNKARKTTRRRQPSKTTPRRRQKKRSQRKPKRKSTVPSYSRNIYKLLKCIFPDLSISRMAMDVMNSFFIDVLDRIASEASTLVYLSKKLTMGYNDIISATKLVIQSPEMRELAINAAKVTVDWCENH